MKLLLLLLPFVFFISFIQPGTAKETYNLKSADVTYVYICDSQTAYAYHSTKVCRGLNRCTHQIIKVIKNHAINKYYWKKSKECR